MNGCSELRINRVADTSAARPVRHALAAFIVALGSVDDEARDAILTAVGEALANVVEHAYKRKECQEMELFARLEPDRTLAVDVWDRGTFVERASPAERGFGLRIIRAIARSVTIDVNGGTHVRMLFDTTATKKEPA